MKESLRMDNQIIYQNNAGSLMIIDRIYSIGDLYDNKSREAGVFINEKGNCIGIRTQLPSGNIENIIWKQDPSVWIDSFRISNFGMRPNRIYKSDSIEDCGIADMEYQIYVKCREQFYHLNLSKSIKKKKKDMERYTFHPLFLEKLIYYDHIHKNFDPKYHFETALLQSFSNSNDINPYVSNSYCDHSTYRNCLWSYIRCEYNYWCINFAKIGAIILIQQVGIFREQDSPAADGEVMKYHMRCLGMFFTDHKFILMHVHSENQFKDILHSIINLDHQEYMFESYNVVINFNFHWYIYSYHGKSKKWFAFDSLNSNRDFDLDEIYFYNLSGGQKGNSCGWWVLKYLYMRFLLPSSMDAILSREKLFTSYEATMRSTLPPVLNNLRFARMAKLGIHHIRGKIYLAFEPNTYIKGLNQVSMIENGKDLILSCIHNWLSNCCQRLTNDEWEIPVYSFFNYLAAYKKDFIDGDGRKETYHDKTITVKHIPNKAGIKLAMEALYEHILEEFKSKKSETIGYIKDWMDRELGVFLEKHSKLVQNTDGILFNRAQETIYLRVIKPNIFAVYEYHWYQNLINEF